jgi:hypothetical protein
MNRIESWMSQVKMSCEFTILTFRAGFGIYKYLLEAMKYLLKADTAVILQKDFVVQKYNGFMVDTQ